MDELDRVPWESLAHAYGVGPTGPELDFDVQASLAALGRRDPNAMHALWSNICHQGTIYEASAYAVPYLSAFLAGGELDDQTAVPVAVLLADIAVASCTVTLDGRRAGAFGPDVAPRTRQAFAASSSWLVQAAKRHPPATALLDLTVTLVSTDPPTNQQVIAVEQAMENLEG
jgi:hypothetical protein